MPPIIKLHGTDPTKADEVKNESGHRWYTFGTVPVHTIFATRTVVGDNSEIDIERTKKMFSKYGSVESIRLHETKQLGSKYNIRSKTYTRCAFITFKRATEAYGALNDKMRQFYLDGREWRVKIAHKWCQAKFFSDDVAAVIDNSLLVLNDDCLIEIYKYLQPIDVVNLTETCRRLKYFAIENIYKTYKHICIDDTAKFIPINTLRRLLGNFGTYSESIHLNIPYYLYDNPELMWQYLQSVLQFCFKLQKLKISSFDFSACKLVKPFKDVLENLEVIKLHNCKNVKRLGLHVCKQLISLSVTGCRFDNEYILTKITAQNSLRHIKINIAVPDMIPILNKFEQLEHLELNFLVPHFINTKALSLMCLKRLHTLRICCYSYHLQMVNTTENAPQLPELRTFQATWTTLNNHTVVELVRYCKKLESIDIIRCPKVTFDAIHQIVEILQADYLEAAAASTVADAPNIYRPKVQFNYNLIKNGVTLDDRDRQWLDRNRHLITFTQNESKQFSFYDIPL